MIFNSKKHVIELLVGMLFIYVLNLIDKDYRPLSMKEVMVIGGILCIIMLFTYRTYKISIDDKYITVFHLMKPKRSILLNEIVKLEIDKIDPNIRIYLYVYTKEKIYDIDISTLDIESISSYLERVSALNNIDFTDKRRRKRKS